MKLLKDPLVLVLLAGLGLYLVYTQVRNETGDGRVISVDRDALIDFIENRTGEIDRQAASARLDAMPPHELDLLVADHIREQALYREALSLGLDRDDYVMQRRLVQRLEFTLAALSPVDSPLSEQDLLDYFEENQNNYREPARITFTHVYLNPELLLAGEIEQQSAALLEILKKDKVDFSESLGYGDRFLYHRNYVGRPFEDIVSHFGERMAGALFTEGERWQVAGDWVGPLHSEHGVHLVRVRQMSEASVPSFDQLRPRLERDVLRERQRQALDEAIQRIIESYQITIEIKP